MRFIISILLIIVLAFVAEYFFVWWALAPVCFLIVLLFRFRPGKAFLAGFAGIFLLWLIAGLIKDSANGHILSLRMAQLFQLPGSVIFILLGALVGGIAGGLAGWSAGAINKFLAARG